MFLPIAVKPESFHEPGIVPSVCSLFHCHQLIAYLNRPQTTLLSGLFFSRGPFDVARLVVPLWIYPMNAMGGTRPVTNVQFELFISFLGFRPLKTHTLADGYPRSAYKPCFFDCSSGRAYS
jgi:hypothetical protein